MKRSLCIVSAMAVLVIGSCRAGAQAMPSAIGPEGDDDPRGNVHLGAPIAIPLNPTARAGHLGFGLNVGGGYNFNRKHAAVGEFLWNSLFPTNEALAKLRTALGDPSLNARVGVYALTGNYRFELR